MILGEHSQRLLSTSTIYIKFYKSLTADRINCRLPQTPRTPSTAAAHYFDDIFSRSVKPGGFSTTTTTHVRRSSTSRSIGSRSDFATTTATDGEVDDADDEHAPAEIGLGIAAAAAEELAAAEEHVSNYVASQIERVRVRSRGLSVVGAYEDEFEAQLDG